MAWRSEVLLTLGLLCGPQAAADDGASCSRGAASAEVLRVGRGPVTERRQADFADEEDDFADEGDDFVDGEGDEIVFPAVFYRFVDEEEDFDMPARGRDRQAPDADPSVRPGCLPADRPAPGRTAWLR